MFHSLEDYNECAAGNSKFPHVSRCSAAYSTGSLLLQLNFFSLLSIIKKIHQRALIFRRWLCDGRLQASELIPEMFFGTAFELL
jgi:hypothetical protein